MTQAVTTILVIACSFICTLPSSASAGEQVSLLGMISKWQYPDSKINGAEMADGATVNASGDRTVQSIACKATMTTDASVEQVLEFYKSKLKPEPKAETGEAADSKDGRSVIFSNDSDGRPFAMHTIIVNTSQASTTLVITRADGEAETYISWKHYKRL